MTEQQSQSSEDEGDFSSEENPHYIEPEFTIIDERALRKEGRHGGSYSDEEDVNFATEEGGSEGESKITLPLRFICFLGLIFCSIFGFGVLLLTMVLTGLSTVLLFSNHELNESLLHFWKMTLHTAVAGFGFLLGLLSPTLGLGLLGLYFSNEVIDNDILRSVIKSAFNKL